MTSLSQCRGAQSLCTSQSTTVLCAASFCCTVSRLLHCATCRMKVDLTKFTETHEFTFDEVFGHNVDTREVGVAWPRIPYLLAPFPHTVMWGGPLPQLYKHTAKPMVKQFFKGVNATCLAYGQTGTSCRACPAPIKRSVALTQACVYYGLAGSGKTFTMMGTSTVTSSGRRKNPGIYVLAAQVGCHPPSLPRFALPLILHLPPSPQDMFKLLAKKEHEHLDVHVSFYEIYGGRLFDLLNSRKLLRALVDHNEAVNIVGLSDRKVQSVKQLLEIIDYGQTARSTGPLSPPAPIGSAYTWHVTR